MKLWIQTSLILLKIVARSAGPVEFTEWFSAEGSKTSSNECPGYYIKQSDGEVLENLELWG